MKYVKQMINVGKDSYKEVKELSYKGEALLKNSQMIEDVKKKNMNSKLLFFNIFQDNLSF